MRARGAPAVAALALAAVAVAAACAGDGSGPATTAGADGGRARDVDALVEHIRAVHPSPWHDVSEDEFTAAAARLRERLPELGPNETLTELMRLLALLGPRDGHSGIFPLDSHRRPLHLYPLRLYAFADGVRVAAVAGAGRGLVGARVVSIAGRPVAEVAEAVRPLVPADNEASREARLWQWAVVAEVLHGLGLAADDGPVELRLELRGVPVSRTLTPIPARAYAAAFPDLFHPMVPQGLPRRPAPAFLARRERPRWTARLRGGRVVYVAYNVTLGSTEQLARRLERAARARPVRAVVLDLRHNPGGENGTYAPLLDALTALGRDTRLVVLTSRTTFSAAASLLADLESRVPLRVVGEPSGGSPNLFGDPAPLLLESTGWNVQVATRWWPKSRAGEGDPRLAFEPHVEVPVRWSDLAAGRDVALAAALAEALR